jgi:glycosyltransferase involved in cell wall biosynthesis
MRFYTCTPVAFGGGADFFARDSGLLCRGFQSLGIESLAVMPGERRPEDQEDLIRTDYRNLESAEWWRTQGLDGVVLYAWGRPRFRKVARAIHEAGIFLVLNQDSGGLVSPLAGCRDWLREQWIMGGQGCDARAWARFIHLTTMGLTKGLLATDPLRAWHLKQGDVIACVSPKAAEHYRRLCGVYGGADLANRVAVVPHAVETHFQHSGEEKKRQLVCVGRWQDHIQKRPGLLMDVIGKLVARDHGVSVVIVGSLTPELEQWWRNLDEGLRSRVDLRGRLNRSELAEVMEDSQVFYSPSAYESFGIAAAEALCCGCSVVGGRSVSMASFEWFVSEGSGMLAEQDDAAGHLEALKDELEAWDRGNRDPDAISGFWCERLHAEKVAAMVVDVFKVARFR